MAMPLRLTAAVVVATVTATDGRHLYFFLVRFRSDSIEDLLYRSIHFRVHSVNSFYRTRVSALSGMFCSILFSCVRALLYSRLIQQTTLGLMLPSETAVTTYATCHTEHTAVDRKF